MVDSSFLDFEARYTVRTRARRGGGSRRGRRSHRSHCRRRRRLRGRRVAPLRRRDRRQLRQRRNGRGLRAHSHVGAAGDGRGLAGRGVARRTVQPLDSSGAPALEPADDASAVSAAKGGLSPSWRRPATPLQPPELGSVPLDAFAAEFEFWAFHASRPGKGDLELLPRAAAPASADLTSARVGRGYCCGVAVRGGRCRRGGARALAGRRRRRAPFGVGGHAGAGRRAGRGAGPSVGGVRDRQRELRAELSTVTAGLDERGVRAARAQSPKSCKPTRQRSGRRVLLSAALRATVGVVER